MAASQNQIQDDARAFDFDNGILDAIPIEFELPSDFDFNSSTHTPFSPLPGAESSPRSVIRQSLRTVELVIRDIRAEPESTFGQSDVLDRMMNLYFDLKQGLGQEEGST